MIPAVISEYQSICLVYCNHAIKVQASIVALLCTTIHHVISINSSRLFELSQQHQQQQATARAQSSRDTLCSLYRTSLSRLVCIAVTDHSLGCPQSSVEEYLGGADLDAEPELAKLNELLSCVYSFSRPLFRVDPSSSGVNSHPWQSTLLLQHDR